MQRPRVVDQDRATFEQRLTGGLSSRFHSEGPIFIGRAPGRLDVMGGIADYSGSLVCEVPLDLACYVAMQCRSDGKLVIETLPWSDKVNDDALPASFPPEMSTDSYELRNLAVELSVQSLCGSGGGLCAAEELAGRLEPSQRWAGYPLGVIWSASKFGLADPRNGPLSGGLSVVVCSQVPAGAGVSSSAAVEVATLQALLALLGRDDVGALDRARVCQEAENRVVGAPCGIMDQVTSLLGEAGCLLKLLCQPHEVQGQIRLPAGVRVVGIDSGVKHEVGGSKYADARTSAFMGHKIIVTLMRLDQGLRDGSDPTGGYLARVSPEDFKRSYRPQIPIRIKGSEFLQRWGEPLDTVTRVDPNRHYRLRSRTEHHVYESERVREFSELLSSEAGEEELVRAGELMYASHWSYGQRCGLGSVETEFLVSVLRSQGVGSGVYGAKITGGGSGGTVAVLCRDHAASTHALQQAVAQYEAKFGHAVRWFTGSGPGAMRVGVQQTSLASV